MPPPPRINVPIDVGLAAQVPDARFQFGIDPEFEQARGHGRIKAVTYGVSWNPHVGQPFLKRVGNSRPQIALNRNGGFRTGLFDPGDQMKVCAIFSRPA